MLDYIQKIILILILVFGPLPCIGQIFNQIVVEKNDSVPNIVAKNYNRNLRIERISRTIIGNKYRYDIDATYHDTLFVIQSYCDIENKSTKGIELEIGKTYPMSLIAEKMDLSDYDELDFWDLFFMWDKRKIMKINDRPLIFTSPNLCGKRYVAKVE